jgi:uridine kinase
LIDGDTVRRVAVDGVDGAGKTVFADELGDALDRRGITVLRASVDGFHHPPHVRYRRGRRSPEGFFLDSYDYPALERLLLRPLDPGAGPDPGVDRRIVRAIYDVAAERPLPHEVETAPAPGVLLIDGIFLHRPELRPYWDYSIFLEVAFDVSVARLAGRDGSDPDPWSPRNHRYVQGQRLYLRTCRPHQHATVVIDNTILAAASVMESCRGW